ncbi:MAG: hypothetical protein PHE33_03185 [Bacteroidales bacterium]|nr:hypothetical protein [Bacteroidales bacterium]
MKLTLFYKLLKIVLFLELVVLYFSYSLYISPINNKVFYACDTIYHNFDTSFYQGPPEYKPKPIASLSLEELWSYYLTNPCYLPLIKDSSLWEPGKNIGFNYADLCNDSLPSDHTYRNRYLVGDFNVIDNKGNTHSLQEVYPKMMDLRDFDNIPIDILRRLDSLKYGTKAYDSVLQTIDTVLSKESASILMNFLSKVWSYKMLPISRDYSFYWSSLFSAGQYVVLCEACEDTLIMISKFATSAKRLNIGHRTNEEGLITEYYYTDLPIGRYRNYYAGLNTVSSKHWEYGRFYDLLDKLRDEELGGGHNRIVMYRNKVELSNFLLLVPHPDYPKAMKNNGIHEVALNDVARGMLGTANSVGCLRVSDFAAKFLRWWTPQDCKLFIAYNDTCYDNRIEYEGNILDYLPFKTEQEGLDFRKWINTFYPYYAKILEIDEEGSYRNGYIIDGYYHFKDEYDNCLVNKELQQE